MFQASGQGVYFSQGKNTKEVFWGREINEETGVWFSHMHLDRLPSAISRYRNEVRHILGVLNTALEGKKYLVGDKVTIADLSFVPRHSIIPVRLLTS